MNFGIDYIDAVPLVIPVIPWIVIHIFIREGSRQDFISNMHTESTTIIFLLKVTILSSVSAFTNIV